MSGSIKPKKTVKKKKEESYVSIINAFLAIFLKRKISHMGDNESLDQ